MTDDDVRLWAFVIETFGCTPPQFMRTVSATDWQKVLIVRDRQVVGADRRDFSAAIVGRQIVAAMNGKDTPIENLIPVKPFAKAEQSAEDIAGIMTTIAAK